MDSFANLIAYMPTTAIKLILVLLKVQSVVCNDSNSPMDNMVCQDSAGQDITRYGGKEVKYNNDRMI